MPATKTKRTKVLFICIGNFCRSPVAEAIAWQDASQEIDASSAGLFPLGFVADMTTQTLTKNGYAAAGLASKPIALKAWESADIVVNMSGRSSKLAFQDFRDHAKIENWEVEDPYGDSEKYQGTYEKVQERVAELIARLRKQSASADHSPNSNRHS